MKTLILTNHSNKIAALNALTDPNKIAYAKRHDYDYKNIEWPYEQQIKWLELIRSMLFEYDVVMTMGCDTLFMNHRIKIESMLFEQKVILAREHISWWPINNDVMIWPKGVWALKILTALIRDSEIWLKYRWLWQAHLWDLMQGELQKCIRVVEAREMNATFQPYQVLPDGQVLRQPGPSSYQFGDWIFHALDMPLDMRINVIKFFLPFAGEPLYGNLPNDLTNNISA